MIRRCSSIQIGFFGIATRRGGIALQSIITLAIILAGIKLGLNAAQWVLLGLTSAGFLIISFYRSATMLVLQHDPSISNGQATRIRAMSNMVMAITSGFTLFAHMLVLFPSINQLI